MAVKIFLSACLVGQCCRYDAKNGESIVNDELHGMLNMGQTYVMCPEMAGGLDVPRAPAEIAPGCTAADVLDGNGKVINADGEDVTANFVAGANRTLAKIQQLGIKVAVLKSGSPSCSCCKVHDGSFTGGFVEGRGVTAELLHRNGIRIYGEDELEQALSEVR